MFRVQTVLPIIPLLLPVPVLPAQLLTSYLETSASVKSAGMVCSRALRLAMTTRWYLQAGMGVTLLVSLSKDLSV